METTINFIRLKLLPWFIAINFCFVLLCFALVLCSSLFCSRQSFLHSFFLCFIARRLNCVGHLNWLQNFQINRNYLAALLPFPQLWTFVTLLLRTSRRDASAAHAHFNYHTFPSVIPVTPRSGIPFFPAEWTPCKWRSNACGAICGNVWPRRMILDNWEKVVCASSEKEPHGFN